MIELTRLNGTKFRVNPDLIKYFEAVPDTTLTLVTGEKLLVLETYLAVAALVTEYRVDVLRIAWPDVPIALSAKAGYGALLAAYDHEGDRLTPAARG